MSPADKEQGRRGLFRRRGPETPATPEEEPAATPDSERRIFRRAKSEDSWSSTAWDDGWDDDWSNTGARASVRPAADPRPEAVDAWLASSDDQLGDITRDITGKWGGTTPTSAAFSPDSLLNEETIAPAVPAHPLIALSSIADIDRSSRVSPEDIASDFVSPDRGPARFDGFDALDLPTVDESASSSVDDWAQQTPSQPFTNDAGPASKATPEAFRDFDEIHDVDDLAIHDVDDLDDVATLEHAPSIDALATDSFADVPFDPADDGSFDHLPSLSTPVVDPSAGASWDTDIPSVDALEPETSETPDAVTDRPETPKTSAPSSFRIPAAASAVDITNTSANIEQNNELGSNVDENVTEGSAASTSDSANDDSSTHKISALANYQPEFEEGDSEADFERLLHDDLSEEALAKSAALSSVQPSDPSEHNTSAYDLPEDSEPIDEDLADLQLIDGEEETDTPTNEATNDHFHNTTSIADNDRPDTLVQNETGQVTSNPSDVLPTAPVTTATDIATFAEGPSVADGQQRLGFDTDSPWEPAAYQPPVWIGADPIVVPNSATPVSSTPVSDTPVVVENDSSQTVVEAADDTADELHAEHGNEPAVEAEHEATQSPWEPPPDGVAEPGESTNPPTSVSDAEPIAKQETSEEKPEELAAPVESVSTDDQASTGPSVKTFSDDKVSNENVSNENVSNNNASNTDVSKAAVSDVDNHRDSKQQSTLSFANATHASESVDTPIAASRSSLLPEHDEFLDSLYDELDDYVPGSAIGQPVARTTSPSTSPNTASSLPLPTSSDRVVETQPSLQVSPVPSSDPSGPATSRWKRNSNATDQAAIQSSVDTEIGNAKRALQIDPAPATPLTAPGSSSLPDGSVGAADDDDVFAPITDDRFAASLDALDDDEADELDALRGADHDTAPRGKTRRRWRDTTSSPKSEPTVESPVETGQQQVQSDLPSEEHSPAGLDAEGVTPLAPLAGGVSDTSTVAKVGEVSGKSANDVLDDDLEFAGPLTAQSLRELAAKRAPIPPKAAEPPGAYPSTGGDEAVRSDAARDSIFVATSDSALDTGRDESRLASAGRDDVRVAPTKPQLPRIPKGEAATTPILRIDPVAASKEVNRALRADSHDEPLPLSDVGTATADDDYFYLTPGLTRLLSRSGLGLVLIAALRMLLSLVSALRTPKIDARGSRGLMLQIGEAFHNLGLSHGLLLLLGVVLAAIPFFLNDPYANDESHTIGATFGIGAIASFIGVIGGIGSALLERRVNGIKGLADGISTWAPLVKNVAATAGVSLVALLAALRAIQSSNNNDRS